MQKTLKIKNEPYWWSDAKPEFVAQEEWPSNADVVIVGAGYTGLSAALTLLDSGLKVISHLMPDLPFATMKDDIQMMTRILLNSDLLCDEYKIEYSTDFWR